jgi:hypothetical protein
MFTKYRRNFASRNFVTTLLAFLSYLMCNPDELLLLLLDMVQEEGGGLLHLQIKWSIYYSILSFFGLYVH